MPENLKTFLNRCRCCLEKFFEDERVSIITCFFNSQFEAFTGNCLDESDLLSNRVCEFCHQELLRFSVFKKDLIEKQQKLQELLKHHITTHQKKTKKSKSKNVLKSIEISSADEVRSEVSEEAADDQEAEESGFSSPDSDDERDKDFTFSRKNLKLKYMIPPEPQEEKQFQCDYCQALFKAKQGLTRHVQSHISLSVPWPCEIKGCKFAASSKIKLNLHKQVKHHIPVPQVKADQPKKLIIEQQPFLKQEFECFCGAKFATMFSLRAHRNRLHRRHNKCIYGCKNVQYVKRQQFLQHVKSKHPNKYQEVLKQAITKIKEPKIPSLQCDQCNYKTAKKLSMKTHLESHMEEGEMFECVTCSEKFATTTSLKDHCETIHESIRRYKCVKCGSAFKQIASLKEHVTIVHGDGVKKKFKCNFCGLRFLQRNMLIQHQQTAHYKREVTSISPLIKRAKQKLAINIQSQGYTNKIHDRKASVSCPKPGCLGKFTSRFHLLTHQKARGHLSDEELKKVKFACICGKKFFSSSGFSYHRGKKNCQKKNPIYDGN